MKADTGRRFAAAVVSGLLLFGAFPPLDWGWLAFVALVPLLWAWRDQRPRRAALYGFVAGLVFFTALLSWISYFGIVALVPLVAAMAAYWAVAGALVAWFARRGVRGPWIIALVWVPLEWLRGIFPLGGFPWGQVGGALHDLAPARAVASWGGLLLVSFLVVVVNALLLDVALAVRTGFSKRLVRAGAGLLGVVVVGAALDVGRITTTPTHALRIAVLQGNDLDRYLTPAEQAARLITNKHFALAARELHGDYDLIVFPESSLDGDDPTVDTALRDRLVALGRAHDSYVMANGITHDAQGREYNTNLLYAPDGTLVGTYSKRHLVPFGEYVPWRSQLSFIDALKQIPHDFTPGTHDSIWPIRGVDVGSIICFESVFSAQVRDVVREGAQLIVVSTNNRSYRRSAASAQHLALSQMRAAETGRPVVQAAISGISAFIDADGVVHDATRLFVPSVISSPVMATTGETPYVRFGNWIVWGSLGILLGLAATLVVARRRGSGGGDDHRAPGEQVADGPSAGDGAA